MQILPLKFIHDDDKKDVGLDLFNLAKLNHLGLPVVESVIVMPPVEAVKKLLGKYSHQRINIKNYLGNLKQEILRLKVPESLTDIYTVLSTGNGKSRFNLNIDALWKNLLEKWSYELVSKIERAENNLGFTPQQVVFSSDFEAQGLAFYDEGKKHVVVNIERGKVNFKQSEEIERLVHLGNRKLVLPQVFYWVLEDSEIKIIRLSPYTQSLPVKEIINPEISPIMERKYPRPKTVTKILLDYSGQVLSGMNADLVFLRIQKGNVDELEQHINRILEYGDTPIIFYPDFELSPEKNLEYAKAFLFYKNKRQLNCQLVLPQTFSIDEYLRLKTQFASLGIYSKGNLKIWKQFITVSDFINIDEYIDAGFDGAAINLDKIIKIVSGVDAEIFLSEPRFDWINAVVKFFKESGFKKIVKKEKLVLVFGKCIQNEELLNFFISSGIWGIAYEKSLIGPMSEHIVYLEKNMLKTNPH